MQLQEIASLLGCEITSSNTQITGMNTLKDASASEISFIANSKYIKEIQTTKAAAVIINAALVEHLPQGCVALVVEHPYWSMAELSKYFAPSIEELNAAPAIIGEGSNISPKVELAKGSVIGKNCTILAHVYVGANTRIGDNTIIYPNVTIYRDCVIGNDCRIHAGAVIGGDGFGFASNKRGEHKKIYQNGNVVIEDDVEIGNNTTIDRAVFGSTIIKKGARLDNLIQVGHNCEIGEYAVAAAQSGFAGSSIIGRSNVFGAQSGVSGHLKIAPFNTFAARTGVTKNVEVSGKTFAGFPFMDHKLWLKIQGKLARLVKQ